MAEIEASPVRRAGLPAGDIHREQVDPDIYWTAWSAFKPGHVSLLEIGPDAMWEDTPEEYRMAEITRVNFADDYENALHLAGSVPSAVSKGR